MTQALENLTGRTTAVTTHKCVKAPFGCEREISFGEIETWDRLTIQEYKISGMCKKCQDEVFHDDGDGEY